MKSYKVVRVFNSCDEIVLYVKRRQNMLFSQKKRKEKQTNKPQWQLNMSSVAKSGWLFVQFGS